MRARSLAVAALTVAGAASCATAPPARDVPHAVRGLAIAPYASTETCVDLAPGDRLDYRFEANETVHFDIRYHEAGAVVSPIVRERSRGDSGIFRVQLPERYCLDWEAGAAGALLDYVIEIRGPSF